MGPRTGMGQGGSGSRLPSTDSRKTELLAARWDLIDWQRGILTLPTSKSGKPRFVELPSNVIETLRGVPGREERPLIFPDCRKISHRVKALGGWNQLEMVERYFHLAPAHKRAAVERLAQADPLRKAVAGSASGTYTGISESEAAAVLQGV